MDDQADKQPLGADGALPARMLACIRCQRSKVRCDRTMPCSNCVRRGIQCIPGSAVAPRQRRKRFPERELLDRLRAYEALLKQNSIDFEPLHKDSPSEPASKIAYRDSKSPTSDDDESDAEGYLVGSKLERTCVVKIFCTERIIDLHNAATGMSSPARSVPTAALPKAEC